MDVLVLGNLIGILDKDAGIVTIIGRSELPALREAISPDNIERATQLALDFEVWQKAGSPRDHETLARMFPEAVTR